MTAARLRALRHGPLLQITEPQEALPGDSVEISWSAARLPSDKYAAVHTVKAGRAPGDLKVVGDCGKISTRNSCSVAISSSLAAGSKYFLRVEAFATAEVTEPVAGADHELTVKGIVWSDPTIEAASSVFAGGSITARWSKSTIFGESRRGRIPSQRRKRRGKSLRPVGDCDKSDDLSSLSCSVTIPAGLAESSKYFLRVEAFTSAEAMEPVTGADHAMTIRPRSSAASVGKEHACALLGDGSVKRWGRNSHGQLGIGTTVDQARPVATLKAAGSEERLTGAQAIAAGGAYS